MKKRFLALDILRGLTVTLMIVVNNPGSWDCMFPPLRHAAWEGCTLCDLVFPFFLFCVGVSMAFSLSKYTSFSGDAVKKVLKRGLLLYLVGLMLNTFPFVPTAEQMDPNLNFWQNWLEWLKHIRLMGVLPRIAISYVLGSILVLTVRKTKWQIGLVALFSSLYVALLLIFAGPEGAFTLEGNFARQFDIIVMGVNHVYHGYGLPFEPEGLLGTLTGLCTVLLGYFSGKIVQTSSPDYRTVVKHLLVYGAGALVLGLILSIWIPISKPLWSVSYVFYAGGWAILALAVIAYVVDVKGWEKWAYPFKAMGMNALAMFVMSGMLYRILRFFTDWNAAAIFGVNEWMSLLHASIYMVFHLTVAIILYKYKIFIKL